MEGIIVNLKNEAHKKYHAFTWCSSISIACSNVVLMKSWKFAVAFVNNGDVTAGEVAPALSIAVSWLISIFTCRVYPMPNLNR